MFLCGSPVLSTIIINTYQVQGCDRNQKYISVSTIQVCFKKTEIRVVKAILVMTYLSLILFGICMILQTEFYYTPTNEV